MTPIKIPDTCKPGLDITLGYSGGMALYVADENSFRFIFKPIYLPYFINDIVTYSMVLN